MNLVYAVLQQIQSDNWYNVSKEMEIAKGKNKIGLNHKIKRKIYSFLYKIKTKNG